MDDEPLEQWARRREERQARNKGRLRQVPLWGGPHRAVHLHPDQPRVIQESDGTGWVTIGVVPNLQAAQEVLFGPPAAADEQPATWDRPAAAKPRGRHRRPARGDF
ncbi:DUF6087 family protein [Streptomyces noursei]|uniref:DUF6087 family protein n=1 Tax=Streptomyces noursei TaxID=1971 RepID=UPI00344B9B9A